MLALERVASKMTHAKPIQTRKPFAWVFGKTLGNYPELIIRWLNYHPIIIIPVTVRILRWRGTVLCHEWYA